MMKRTRIAALCGILLLGLLTLTACGGFDAKALVQGNLDVIYLGTYDQDYLDMVEITEEEAEASYNEGIENEATFFCDYFDVDWDALTAEGQQAILDMYKQIYQHSKYEVGEVTRNSDTYLVELTVYPIDIIKKFVDEDSDFFLDSWQHRLDTGEFDLYTDEEFEQAWASEIVTLISARLDNIGYLDPETISVQIAQDDDGYYVITDNDFQRIDELMIAY